MITAMITALELIIRTRLIPMMMALVMPAMNAQLTSGALHIHLLQPARLQTLTVTELLLTILAALTILTTTAPKHIILTSLILMVTG